MYEIGIGKADMTIAKKGIGMMGYGMFFNKVENVETPLSVRTFIFRDPSTSRTFCFVNAEICFITISLKLGVLKKLKRKHPEIPLKEENLMLTAQHTHSGPGGYSHYGFYNFSIPGFVPEVYQRYVDGITESIVKAWENREPGTLQVDWDEFPEDWEVAFNRSLKAYNSNPEVQKRGPVSKNNAHLAVDRSLKLMRINDAQGNPRGMINWFGVHTTSISNDNHSITPDNKGYASLEMEETMAKEGHPDFVAAFAQDACGDISPNYLWDKDKKWTRGKFKDDFKSARYNGHLQHELAKKVFDSAGKQVQMPVEVDSSLAFVDFTRVNVDPEFTEGKMGCHTAPAAIAVSMLTGTVEGPGLARPAGVFAKMICRIGKWVELLGSLFMRGKRKRRIREKYRAQGKKDIIMETSERKILFTRNVKKLVIPAWADGVIATMKLHHERGGLSEERPWIPEKLPIQIAILGDLAFVGIPGEITTIAAERLRKTLKKYLFEREIRKVVLCPYANAYCGYITTHQEYDHQLYEAGHTVYGKWTLAAFQTKFKKLAREMTLTFESRKFLDRSVRPPEFSLEELRKRTYDGDPLQQLKAVRKGEKVPFSVN